MVDLFWFIGFEVLFGWIILPKAALRGFWKEKEGKKERKKRSRWGLGGGGERERKRRRIVEFFCEFIGKCWIFRAVEKWAWMNAEVVSSDGSWIRGFEVPGRESVLELRAGI